MTACLRIVIGLAIATVGCSRIHVPHKPEVPKQFKELLDSPDAIDKVKSSSVQTDEAWWISLGDEGLNQVLGQLFAQNLQLLQAKERVIQMRSLATQAGSQRWPSANLEIGWSRTKQLNPFARLNRNSGSPPPGVTGAPSNGGP